MATRGIILTSGKMVLADGRGIHTVVRMVFTVGRMVLPVARMVLPTARMVLPVARIVLPLARIVLPVARMVLPTAKLKWGDGNIVLENGKMKVLSDRVDFIYQRLAGSTVKVNTVNGVFLEIVFVAANRLNTSLIL